MEPKQPLTEEFIGYVISSFYKHDNFFQVMDTEGAASAIFSLHEAEVNVLQKRNADLKIEKDESILYNESIRISRNEYMEGFERLQAENTRLREALDELVELKKIKDTEGKNRRLFTQATVSVGGCIKRTKMKKKKKLTPAKFRAMRYKLWRAEYEPMVHSYNKVIK